jgi:hypothetical protein
MVPDRRSLLLMLLLSAAPLAVAGADFGVVDEAVASQWPLTGPRMLPPYPAELAGRAEPACVALGYRVDRQGRTSAYAVLRAWTAAAGSEADTRHRLKLFARNSAAAVAHWRFAPPARRHGDWPVYTMATFAYLPSGGAVQDVRRHCGIADFPAFIARARQRLGERGSLMLGRMDRKQQTDPAMIPYDKHDWFDGMFGPGD